MNIQFPQDLSRTYQIPQLRYTSNFQPCVWSTRDGRDFASTAGVRNDQFSPNAGHVTVLTYSTLHGALETVRIHERQ